MAVSDRVTVLRAGRRSRPCTTADATPQSLAALMVGRDVEVVTPRRARAAREPAGARARRTSGSTATAGTPAVKDVSLTVRAGRDRRRRRRLRQRPARARARRSPACDRAEGLDPRRAARRSQNGDARVGVRGGDRLRAGGPARHRRGADALDRDEPRAQVVPRRVARAVPAARAGCASEAEEAIRDLRDQGVRARSARPTTSPAATSRSSCSRASSPASPKVLVAASPTRGLDVAAVEAVHALPPRSRRARRRRSC